MLAHHNKRHPYDIQPDPEAQALKMKKDKYKKDINEINTMINKLSIEAVKNNPSEEVEENMELLNLKKTLAHLRNNYDNIEGELLESTNEQGKMLNTRLESIPEEEKRYI